jgi:hypothetical protein
MPVLQPRREASLSVSRKAAIQLVLEASKDDSIWPGIQQRRVASLSVSRKAAIQLVLEADVDA